MLVVMLGSLACLAFAGGLPWEDPLNKLKDSLIGPTAQAIAIVGLFVAGGLLVFGGELSDFSRRITWMVLALSVMLAGVKLLTALGLNTGGAAALI
jgi:type IV secretion system protein VirB2